MIRSISERVTGSVLRMSRASDSQVGSRSSGCHHPIDQTPGAGGLRVEEVAGQRQFLGAVDPDQAGQPLRKTPAGHHANSCMSVREAGLGRGDEEVAHQRKFEPAGDGESVDRANDRLVHLGEGVAEISRADRGPGVGFAAEFLEVETDGERATGARSG